MSDYRPNIYRLKVSGCPWGVQCQQCGTHIQNGSFVLCDDKNYELGRQMAILYLIACSSGCMDILQGRVRADAEK